MRTPEDTPTDADQVIRYGTIASVDLAARRIVVDLDDDSQSPPIRWFEIAAGKKRTSSRPATGEQVMLFCPSGEIGAAMALRGLPSDLFPLAADSADDVVEYDDGAVLSYDETGHTLTYTLPAGGIFKVTAPGGIAFDGPLHCTGKITSDDDVAVGEISLTGHHHDKVAAGGSLSGGPVA